MFPSTTPLAIVDRNGFTDFPGHLRDEHAGKMIPTLIDGLSSIEIPSKDRKLCYGFATTLEATGSILPTSLINHNETIRVVVGR